MREVRQSIEDQRSMGNIGYIGGNIGYLGTGTLNMDYPYDHGTAPYHLWKPPGNYFARGEAPPPYEEAIALAQAESLNTCTVSVATSTQRQYPLGITETEAPQTITANTTNLINININNGGNLTAIATGENHIVGGDSVADIQTDQIDSVLDSNVTNNNANVETSESRASFPTNYYTIPLIASELCTNQNCDLNVGNTCNYLLSHVQNATAVQTCDSHNTAMKTNAMIPKQRNPEGVTGCSDTINSRTILPPPVFDSIRHDSSTASERRVSTIKYRTIGKRHHRTIPRQFEAVDPIIIPLKGSNNIISPAPHSFILGSDANNKTDRLETVYNENKRLSCQCPVQHMPMKYLSSNSLSVEHNETGSTVLSGTQIGKMPTVNKQISVDGIRLVNLSHHATSVQTKNVHISPAHCIGGTLRKNYYPGEIRDKNGDSNSNFGKTQLYLKNDKATTDNQSHVESQPNLKKQIRLPKTAASHDANIAQKSKHRNGTEKCAHSPNAVTMDTNMHITTNIQQSNSSNDHEAQRKSTTHEKSLEPNPELPPKMHKHNTSRLSGAHQKSYYSNSRTHTISKLSKDGSKLSIPESNATDSYKRVDKQQKINYSKSLPRNVVAAASHEYSQISRNTTQLNNNSQHNNSSSNTLPKKANKMSSRSMNLLTEVVNKVPSVINIPSPLQPPQLALADHNIFVSAGGVPVQFSSRISNNRKSTMEQAATKKSSNQDPSHNVLDHRMNTNEHLVKNEKPLPVLSTYKNCANPKEHFLPNDNSLDDDYLSECENCKSAHGSRYYLEEEGDDAPQETMTLQRKMPEIEDADQQNYYRVSSTLPTNTSRKTPSTKNRETWFTTIPASSSSDEEDVVE